MAEIVVSEPRQRFLDFSLAKPPPGPLPFTQFHFSNLPRPLPGCPVDDRAAKTETSQVPRGGWAVFVALLGMAGVLVLKINAEFQPRKVGLPVVVDDPGTLQFGNRSEGETFVWTVPIRNRTNETVTVDEVRASCDCASVEPRQMVLGPQAVTTLAATIRAKGNPQSPGDGLQFVALTAHSNDRPVFVSYLRGRVRPTCYVDPPAADFATPIVRGTESVPFRMRVRIGIGGSRARIEPQPEVKADLVPNAAGYDLLLRIHPKDAGTWSRSVRLVVEDSLGRTVGTRNVPVDARVVDRVYAEPSSFNVGAATSGSVAEVTAAFKSAIGEAFRIEVGTIPPDVLASAIGDGSTYRVRWRVRPGDQTAEVTFIARLSDGEGIQVPIRIRAYGGTK